jgi:hypothetical protein
MDENGDHEKIMSRAEGKGQRAKGRAKGKKEKA